MLFEKQFRNIAYRIVSRKDGNSGALLHRENFHNFILNDYNQIKQYSFQKLKKIFIHAFKNSKYYRELWNKIGFDPKSMTDFKDIAQLPYLTRDIIENRKEAMCGENISKSKLEISHTGGTSGTHVSFFRDLACTTARVGRQLGILELCGYSLGDRCGLIWGAHEDLPKSEEKLNFKKKFRKFASGKETLCCTIMSSSKMLKYYKRLKKFKPVVMYGYPNAMSLFANFIKDKGLSQIKVKTVICTAEKLTEVQRSLLEEVFESEVFDLYCTREHGCIGFECSEHNGYHIDTGSVHLEIISEGRPVIPGQTGDIIITDLLNYGMPFIRNRIGDRGILNTEQCNCGSPLPLLAKLDGRVTDILYRPDGSTVSGVMLVDMFMDVAEIKEMQIVQEELDEVVLNIVVTGKFNEENEQKAVLEMKEYMGDETNISIKIIPEITRNPVSGKFQEVICRINPPQ